VKFHLAPDIEVGFYHLDGRSIFQRVLAAFLAVGLFELGFELSNRTKETAGAETDSVLG
jgi:hypothetical protein